MENSASSPDEYLKEKIIPREYVDPITLELFKDPVIASDSYTYERESLRKVIRAKAVSPLTNLSFKNTWVTTAITLRQKMKDDEFGEQLVPTPKESCEDLMEEYVNVDVDDGNPDNNNNNSYEIQFAITTRIFDQLQIIHGQPGDQHQQKLGQMLVHAQAIARIWNPSSRYVVIPEPEISYNNATRILVAWERDHVLVATYHYDLTDNEGNHIHRIYESFVAPMTNSTEMVWLIKKIQVQGMLANPIFSRRFPLVTLFSNDQEKLNSIPLLESCSKFWVYPFERPEQREQRETHMRSNHIKLQLARRANIDPREFSTLRDIMWNGLEMWLLST